MSEIHEVRFSFELDESYEGDDMGTLEAYFNGAINHLPDVKRSSPPKFRFDVEEPDRWDLFDERGSL